ncbi:MAG: hypothetical protein WCI67_02625 [Chloroflexales bacterium]
MITIIADRHGYDSPPAGSLVAAKLTDYVPVRRRIRTALDQDEPLTVYATNPVLLGWLGDLQRYPESRIAWRVVDPGEEFTQMFGVAPADPFTPARIAALQLHDLPRVPVGVFVHPLTWILGHRLDPLWQHDEPPPGQITLLAEWALHRDSPLDADSIVLTQAQLERWSACQPIYRAIHATSLADDCANLLLRWALQRYERSWRGTQRWGQLPIIDGEPSPSVLQAVLRGQREAIQAYWDRQMVGVSIDSGFISAALGQMSGMSEAEIFGLTMMLDRQPKALDNQLLQAVRSRFEHLPSAQSMLHNLDRKVTPPQPPLPDSAWPADRWLSWATQQYMPYYAWVIRSGCGREHQQACALRYSDWLYTQYQAWIDDDQSPLLLRQYQDMMAILERDQRVVVIWLIIDGMTWWQGSLMRETCEQYGLHSQAYLPGIAVLPSITSVSKRALVTGQPTIDIAQPTIAEAARVKLARSNIPARVGYSLPDAIEALRCGDHGRVSVVLFNLIDALAHQTTTFTDSAGIRGYLKELASQLRDAQQVCVAQGRRLHVLIGSDHGSTLLPADAPSVPLPQTVREIDDVWEPELSGQEAQRPGTRAAATDLDRIPDIDPQVWYTLDRVRFQLDKHYLVPRGYGYIKRRPSGWTHGGLTPEETIVPLIHLAADRPHVRPIEIEFQGSLRVGQAGTVVVVLRNINSFPVQDVTVAVAGATEEILIIHMGALEQKEAELHFTTVIAQGTELPVAYEVRYNAFGNPQCDRGRAQILLRRLQTDDTSLDDMFN